MAENYKLVSEDEWQAMVDRAEVAEGWSEHWKFKANQAEGELALFLDGKADREEPVEVLSKDNPARQRNGEKNWLWRYDVDGNLIWSGPPELAPAFGEYETDTRDNAERMIQEPSREWTFSIPTETQPQRPHESLVWAIYHAAAMVANFVVNKVDLHPHHAAEKAMGTWRDRWPESE